MIADGRAIRSKRCYYKTTSIMGFGVCAVVTGSHLQRVHLLGVGHGVAAPAAVALQERVLVAKLLRVQQAHDAEQLRHIVLDRRACTCMCGTSEICDLHVSTSVALTLTSSHITLFAVSKDITFLMRLKFLA